MRPPRSASLALALTRTRRSTTVASVDSDFHQWCRSSRSTMSDDSRPPAAPASTTVPPLAPADARRRYLAEAQRRRRAIMTAAERESMREADRLRKNLHRYASLRAQFAIATLADNHRWQS